MDPGLQSMITRAIAAAMVVLVAGCASSHKQPKVVSDETRARLAQALLDSGDPASAAAALHKPPAQDVQKPADPLANAALLINTGQVESGLAIARAALVARGDDPPFAREVARLAFKANRLSDAAIIYDEILRRHPDDVEALDGKGVVLAQQGELSAAASSFRQALARSPNDVATRNNLGLVLILSGKNDEAVPVLKSLQQSNPSKQTEATLEVAEQGLRQSAGAHNAEIRRHPAANDAANAQDTGRDRKRPSACDKVAADEKCGSDVLVLQRQIALPPLGEPAGELSIQPLAAGGGESHRPNATDRPQNEPADR